MGREAELTLRTDGKVNNTGALKAREVFCKWVGLKGVKCRAREESWRGRFNIQGMREDGGSRAELSED